MPKDGAKQGILEIDLTELPRNVEAEQAVLGAAIIDPEALESMLDELRGDEFYHEAHARLYRAMKSLNDEGNPVDIVSLGTRLTEREELDAVGGLGYMTRLASSVPSSSEGSMSYYTKAVTDAFIHRAAIMEMADRLLTAKNTHSTDAILMSMQETGVALADRKASKREFRTIDDICKENFEQLESRYTNRSNGEATGIPSGYVDLDRMTCGFQNSDLIIIAARPSVGKTAFALNIAQNVGIRAKKSVAVFSLEMSASQLVQRMIAAEGNIDASRLRTGLLEPDDWEKVTMSMGALSDAKLFIDDTPAINVIEIRNKCRRLKKEQGLDMILIDYLQLISGTGRRENRQQEVSEISRTLKQLARELEVPVIALSQLSRGVEQRQDKRPMMSDLRESGSIEQDADIVAFLYRDDYYNAESEKKNVIEIILSKQRNGPVGTVELIFLKNYNKFVSLDRSHQEIAYGKSSAPIPDMHRKR
ncbi:replicative DNA helicase [Paenibacillus gansuensis]|uniref:Replicative DNA helicase n=1 Tax=Paenibacillus gansuensis TaxID=306542 RepID=A0ABW5PHS6_9BACL